MGQFIIRIKGILERSETRITAPHPEKWREGLRKPQKE